jgi:hypothetical protein
VCRRFLRRKSSCRIPSTSWSSRRTRPGTAPTSVHATKVPSSHHFPPLPATNPISRYSSANSQFVQAPASKPSAPTRQPWAQLASTPSTRPSTRATRPLHPPAAPPAPSYGSSTAATSTSPKPSPSPTAPRPTSPSPNSCPPTRMCKSRSTRRIS